MTPWQESALAVMFAPRNVNAMIKSAQSLFNLMASQAPPVAADQRKEHVSDMQKEGMREKLAAYAKEVHKVSRNVDTAVSPIVWLEFKDFQTN